MGDSVTIRCGNCDEERDWAFGTGQYADSFCDCDEPYLIPAAADVDGQSTRLYPVQHPDHRSQEAET